MNQFHRGAGPLHLDVNGQVGVLALECVDVFQVEMQVVFGSVRSLYLLFFASSLHLLNVLLVLLGEVFVEDVVVLGDPNALDVLEVDLAQVFGVLLLLGVQLLLQLSGPGLLVLEKNVLVHRKFYLGSSVKHFGVLHV